MISDPFKSVWRDYKNQPNVLERKTFLKQLIAQAFYLTLFTGDTKQRAAVVTIGNRVRKSKYCDIDRKTVYTIWAIANQTKPSIFRKAAKTAEEVGNRYSKSKSLKRPIQQYPQPKTVFEVIRKKKYIKNQ